MSEAATTAPETLPETLVVSARNLGRSYSMGHEVIEVFKGLDLSLRAGEKLAIMGRSGSGKSTLLHLLGLLDRPDTGTLEIAGVATERLSIGRRARLRNDQVGFVFQFYHLIPELNAFENAVLPLMISTGVLRWPSVRERCRDRARQLLDELGLTDRLKHRPGQLSGGERQRVAIARALVTEPSLLLCDEPTGNLDERTADVIADQLVGMSERHGHTLVMATHDSDLAARADRTLVLHDGELHPQSPS